jgi:small subunit ribosomal protein S20
MPIIKSAIKKMRQDKARTLVNRRKIDTLKKVLKQANAKPTSENLSKAFSSLDKAAKKGLIPKARANRKKSRLALKNPTPVSKATPKVKKPISKTKSS